MAQTSRNWNPTIGPAVSHITETQWNVGLPMRELDPGLLRSHIPSMPRGRGITGHPGGYAPGQNPLQPLARALARPMGLARRGPKRGGVTDDPAGGPVMDPQWNQSVTDISPPEQAGEIAPSSTYPMRSPRNNSNQRGYGIPALGVGIGYRPSTLRSTL